MLESMTIIRRVSSRMLVEKMEDTAVALSDTEAKRDIMSLLVRARKFDLEKAGAGYAMSDAAMMDQVVRGSSFIFSVPYQSFYLFS